MYIPGWTRYFQLAAAKSPLNELDSWIKHRLRCYRLKQMKRPRTIAKELMKMGIPEWRAWILALSGKGLWRLSSAPQLHQAMNNKWFEENGLISLEKTYLRL